MPQLALLATRNFVPKNFPRFVLTYWILVSILQTGVCSFTKYINNQYLPNQWLAILYVLIGSYNSEYLWLFTVL